MVFSPDGSTLVIGGLYQRSRLYDRATRKPLGRPIDHPLAALAIRFSADGRQMLFAGEDKVVREELLGDTIEGSIDQVVRRIRSITGLRLDADGAVRPLDVPEAYGDWPALVKVIIWAALRTPRT